ncbi:hypothetical protein ACW5R3_03060 [Bizionia sp. KMM 8389]
MHLSDKQKAILITGLICSSVLLLLFSFQITQFSEKIAESYYLIEPKPDETLTEETLEETPTEKAETNKAYNETVKHKTFAQAYQPIAPPTDYEYTKVETEPTESTTKPTKPRNSSSSLDADILTSYNTVNNLIKEQQNNISEQSVNTKSSMHYSLVNRTHSYLPTPIYLCNTGGKIVVNISVNSQGEVIKSTINKAASTANACLQNHAIEYANQSRFNIDRSKKTQLGSITFQFKGKN